MKGIKGEGKSTPSTVITTPVIADGKSAPMSGAATAKFATEECKRLHGLIELYNKKLSKVPALASVVTTLNNIQKQLAEEKPNVIALSLYSHELKNLCKTHAAKLAELKLANIPEMVQAAIDSLPKPAEVVANANKENVPPADPNDIQIDFSR